MLPEKRPWGGVRVRLYPEGHGKDEIGRLTFFPARLDSLFCVHRPLLLVSTEEE
jgi:hypothetical protein